MFDVLTEMLGVEAMVFRRAALLEIIIWLLMLVAVMIDMRTGIRKAKAMNTPIDSHGLRRSFTKFGDYGKVTGLFMCIDVMAILFGIWQLPYASAVSAFIAIAIEGWSVRENLRAAHSSASKVADIIAEIARTHDTKEVIELLRHLDEMRATHNKSLSEKSE